MNSLQRHILLKKRLKRTWIPFFSRFGRLTPLQEQVIPHVLDGKNLIISSPAATGKTEAAFAPSVERLCFNKGNEDKGLKILYISPTRALVNDIYQRLKAPLMMCGFRSAIRTGERPEYSTKNPEDVLFTTPESLDSMLCRYSQIWKDLRAIILDEIHLIDNTFRGDQLRILLQRLRQEGLISPVQYIALSATIYSPEDMASRYFQDAIPIKAGKPKPLFLHLFSDISELIAFIREENMHKVIFFANSRRDAEKLGTELKEIWPRDRIVIHHGSLSKKVRESTEKVLRQWSWGICIATTTLEIGIDIGDFDAVACYYPPLTPSSFQQRIGRGCRREEKNHAIGFFSTQEEKECFMLFAEMASAGEIEPMYYESDISVVVQQIFSYLFSHPRGEDMPILEAILTSIAEPSQIKTIIDHLLDLDYMHLRRQRYYASEKLMNLAQRGIIHSNIPSFREYRVIDQDSGTLIGRVGMQATPGMIFVLGGRTWEIVTMRGLDLFSRRNSKKPDIKHFRKQRTIGAFWHLLPECLRAK